jgi:tetraacyldisaccharide-1-P 4'-kinase
VAGIGHPGRSSTARSAGLAVESHLLADHAALQPGGLPFLADATVLMTEKDAVNAAHSPAPTGGS